MSVAWAFVAFSVRFCSPYIFRQFVKTLSMRCSLVPICVAIENKMLHGQDFLALPLAGGCHMTCPSQ